MYQNLLHDLYVTFIEFQGRSEQKNKKQFLNFCCGDCPLQEHGQHDW